MISSVNGHVEIEGTRVDVEVNAICILRSIYHMFSDKYGKEIANERLVKIGRLAVMPDEELKEELEALIMDLVMR